MQAAKKDNFFLTFFIFVELQNEWDKWPAYSFQANESRTQSHEETGNGTF